MTEPRRDQGPAEQGPVSILTLQLDAGNPPLLLGDWLGEVGGVLDVRHLYRGESAPGSAQGFDAVLVLGGAMGVYDDDTAPHLREVRGLLASAVAAAVPILAIGLGARVLAAACGGRIAPTDSWRLGANLTAKRDATEQDPLLGLVPITPDVMQFRRDTISALPSGGRMLLNSLDDSIEAFRVGASAWGLQFHIETSAEVLRSWREQPRWGLQANDIERSERRFGPLLDEAAELMGQSWRAVAHRFVQVVREGIPQTPTSSSAARLPIIPND